MTFSALRRRIGAPLALLALVSLVGCEETPPPKTPKPGSGEEAGESANIDKSKAKISEAERAFAAKSYDKARKLLKEASALGVESHRFDIEQLAEKVDKKQAKLWANEAQEKLDGKECAAAFKDLAGEIDALKSEAFTRELRKLVGPPALKCVQAVVDETTVAGKYADARKLVEAPETEAVLGPPAQKKVATELATTIQEAVKGLVAPDVKAKKWTDAVAKIDAAVKRGDVDETLAGAVLGYVRGELAPEIEATASRGVGSREATATLRQVDALIQTVRWEILVGEAAELAKDKALPEGPRRAREALAVWVEGGKNGFKPAKKAEKRWTFGKVALAPGGNMAGETKRDLPGATEVWLLGATKEKGLVADVDPGGGPIASQLGKSIGWVPLDRLAKENTVDWIPPDDQLKGVRVWGPFRAPEVLLELGTVTEVTPKEVTVKRVTDDTEVKVQRKQLRMGRLTVGTVVLAFCKAKDEKAKITEILPGGRAVKLACEGGDVKEETLAGIRARPDMLPPSKTP